PGEIAPAERCVDRVAVRLDAVFVIDDAGSLRWIGRFGERQRDDEGFVLNDRNDQRNRVVLIEVAVFVDDAIGQYGAADFLREDAGIGKRAGAVDIDRFLDRYGRIAEQRAPEHLRGDDVAVARRGQPRRRFFTGDEAGLDRAR